MRKQSRTVFQNVRECEYKTICITKGAFDRFNNRQANKSVEF